MYSKHLKTIPRKIHEYYGRPDETLSNTTHSSNEFRNITVDKKERNTFSRENFDGTHQRHLARVNVVSTLCDLLCFPHFDKRLAADNVSLSTSCLSSLSYFGHTPHGQSVSLSLSLTSIVCLPALIGEKMAVINDNNDDDGIIKPEIKLIIPL